MSKNAKQLTVIWGFVAFVTIAFWIFISLYANNVIMPVERVDASSPGYDYTCPEGQMPIGADACRIIPTGCPWGDSIPMDKCTPPPDLECNEDQSVCWPKGEYIDEYDYKCRSGHFENVKHTCKKPPTGCPYGDAIPMEDCTPPEPKNSCGK